MAWHKWIVRGLVFCCLGGMIFLGVAYQFLTNPDAIRRQVLARLQADLVGVNARVDSARLRLFGGITVQELRLSRRDDLDKSDFLYVPTAILYHDKEHLLQGKLSLRKVEIQRPRLRAVRDRDGRWNLAGLFGPSDPTRPLPTVVIEQGTLVIEDRLAAPGTPPLEIKDVHLTLMNDPLPTINLEGSGTCDVAGSIRLHGQLRRDGAGTLTVELPALTIGPDLIQKVAAYCPDTANDLRGLQARGSIQATFTRNPLADPPFTYAIHGEVRDGKFSHGRLPRPLEHLHGTFRCVNGTVPRAEFHARSGPTLLKLELAGLDFARAAGGAWTEAVDRLDLDARHVEVNGELFKYLPDLKAIQEDYSPTGKLDGHLAFRRLGAGRWRKQWELRARDMNVLYAGFRYPVGKVRGRIGLTTYSPPVAPAVAGSDSVLALDLRGEAGGKPIYLKGEIKGEANPLIKLDLWGNDLTFDEQLLAALPPEPRKTARGFHPTGLLDFHVFMRQPTGQTTLANRFLVHLHDGTVQYKLFPLRLHNVSGTLDIGPDRWAFHEFVGHHKDGVIRASGGSHPMPAPKTPAPVAGKEPAKAERVSLTIRGENLPLDDEFRAALAPGRAALARAVDTFALTGRMNFAARIDELPNQPQDIDVTVSVGGCRMNPKFFPYPLEDVAATVRYAHGSVWLSDFQGRHGATRLGFKRGTVHIKKEGGFWARLDNLAANPLVPDAELKRALPPGLRNALNTVKLSQPIALNTTLVIDQPAEVGLRPTVYWDGTLRLARASLQAGVPCSNVTGQVSCLGRFDGRQLEGLSGNVFLEEATVLGQPLRRVHIPLVVWKNSPDILRLPDVKAQLFGGTLGGEARVEFGSIFRYELVVRASHVELQQFGRHNFKGKPAAAAASAVELSGLATASLHLTGEGTDPRDVKGSGRLDVPSGKLYRLPLLLDLLKWLGLRLPDRTAFEQAHATFAIDGPRMRINELDLFGSAISVRGQGSMNLDGSNLNIDLNADWGRLAQLLPPGISDVSRGISNQLLKIKVRGKVGDVRFEKELVPVVTDPLKRVWSGLTGGRTKAPAPPP